MPQVKSVQTPTQDDVARYERLTAILPMDRLRSATAILGGLGALGNEVGKQLSLLGVGNVIACDMDHVEIHNLTRSVLYRRSDTGRLKAEAAAEAMKAINPDVNVVPFTRSIAELGLGVFRRADMIFSTFDAIFPRLIVNEACLRVGRPWVDGGLSAFNAYAGMACIYDAQDAANACFACSYKIADLRREMDALRGTVGCGANERRLAAVGGVPTTPMMGAVVAAMQVTGALALIGVSGGMQGAAAWLNAEFEVNLWAGSSRRKRKKRFPGCYHHDALQIVNIESQVVEVPEWSSESTTPRDILTRAAAELECEHVVIVLPEIYITEGTCRECGRAWEALMPRSSYRLGTFRECCRHCGATGFDAVGEGSLNEISLASPYLDMPLKMLGLRALDVLEVVAADEFGDVLDRSYYEITGDKGLFGWQ